MKTSRVWAKRVAEWRASGLSSLAFSEGRDFTAGGLRHMAHELWSLEQPSPLPLRFARVVPVARTESAPGPVPRSDFDGAVTIDIGPARVVVGRGADPRTLALVVAALLDGAAR